ncbi:hypothetical protein NOK61_23940 [Vibrio parahaemolyticus]|nr:hypothetical protein [Vibrio parahaemolyticus]
MRKHRYCVAHTLTGRYVVKRKYGNFITSGLSA